WEDQVVYHQPNKAESVAWALFKDGMRSLTIRRGAESEELPRFLQLINQARFLAADAGDDLLTLLWEQEYEFIQYKFIEFFGEGGGDRLGQQGRGGGADRGEPAACSCGAGSTASSQGRGRRRGLRLDALLPGRARDQHHRGRTGGRVSSRCPWRRPERPVRPL